MNEKISKSIDLFSRMVTSKEDVTADKVVSLLDVIATELNLLHVYVLECTGASNQFIYPYASTGPASGVVFHNLIVFQEDDVGKLVNLFRDGLSVFDGQISSSRRATAEGNLAYGYVEDGICIGFVSFQPKEGDEGRVWTDEEKEIIRALALAIRPLIYRRQITDRFAYAKNIANTSIGLFWYYPMLKLIIVPEVTMDRFSIRQFVYRDAPESFISDILSEDSYDMALQAFKSIVNDKPSDVIHCASRHEKGKFYHISLNTNRFDDSGNPVEIMGMVEHLSLQQKEYEEKTEIFKRYEKFKQAVSDNNISESFVNLITGKMTPFKMDDIFSSCYDESTDFDSFMSLVKEKYVSPEWRESFGNIMNSSYLREYLSQDRKNVSLSTNFEVNGVTKRYEFVVALSSSSIYDYAKEAMMFVRDVSFKENRDYDRLTGLLNMSHFLSALSDRQSEMKEKGENAHGVVVYFDFAQFKFYNLQYGISKGDECLKQFADILREVYHDELIARFSDDHYVVLDTSLDADARSIIKVEETLKHAKKISDSFDLKIKAGIYHLRYDVEAAICVDYAQMACQDIKKNPNSNYREYDDVLKVKTEQRKYVCDHIDEAIRNKWIKVFYQPVIDSRDKSLVAMEALTRWEDPLYGFLSPANFIDALEQVNLLYKLDVFVINQICERLRNEMDKGHKVVPISFNLSRNDFLSCKPFDEVEKCVEKYHIDRSLICVEITESITMENPELIHKAIDQFRDNHYEVWMDDFGSGYSSLNVLKDFSFDEIKIDMAFLRNFNDKSKTIVRNIVNMANELNIRTLTEGAETLEQVDFLTEIGCERIQGYYYGKPLPFEQLMEHLKEKNIPIK